MEKNTWLGIRKNNDTEITVKHSRFIASLRSVATAEEVARALKEIYTLYPRATHYCYAYRLGAEAKDEYGSDAGEPSGTAGRPILGALKRHDLTNTLLVVTRYFGGVKLGVPGLISAYGDAAEAVIEDSNIATFTMARLLHIECSYDMAKSVRTTLAKCGVGQDRVKTEWGENVTLDAVVLCSLEEKVAENFGEFSARGLLISFEWQENLQCEV